MRAQFSALRQAPGRQACVVVDAAAAMGSLVAWLMLFGAEKRRLPIPGTASSFECCAHQRPIPTVALLNGRG
jgi:hypothetical protein